MQVPRIIPRLPSSTSLQAMFRRQPFTTASGLWEQNSGDGASMGDLKALPEPSSSDGVQRVEVNSDQGLVLDQWGPIVVNKDGSMSRITNWDKMAAVEKESTLRILKKRNRARLDALKESDAGEAATGEQGEGHK